MMNFKEFHDDEGPLYVDIREIAYFYEANEDEKEQRGVNTVLVFKNQNSLSVTEKITTVIEVMKWV